MNETWWVTENELDEDQRGVISLPLDGRYLISGPPGSGKTNLLLLRAKYLTLAGHPNLAVVVFTRPLRDFIASGSANYELDSDRVLTSQQFYIDFLREHGEHSPRGGDFESNRRAHIQRVLQLIKKNNICHTYDAILLDEAQDYLTEEIEIFDRLARRPFVVTDSRQRIYREGDGLAIFRENAVVRQLRHHYRNGYKICALADAIAKESDDYEPLSACANYDEKSQPSSVDLVRADSSDQQFERIHERLLLQRKAYPNDLIGVLAPLRDDASALFERLRATDLADHVVFRTDEEALNADQRGLVIVSTIHAAKGLEFRAVHIANTEGVKKFKHNRNLIFTGITRAKTAVSLYHTKAIPSFIAGAFAKLEPLPDLPKIADLFRRNE